jgi:dTDP-glucose 4,6-dehydratase
MIPLSTLMLAGIRDVLVIDASKIGRELGWKPRRTFEEGLHETARWYLEHRDWCEAIQSGRYDRQRLGLGH